MERSIDPTPKQEIGPVDAGACVLRPRPGPTLEDQTGPRVLETCCDQLTKQHVSPASFSRSAFVNSAG